MNYPEAIQFLYNSRMMGTKLGLNNIRFLLEQLGNPQQKYRTIHIAGTNGKGSVSAMLESILRTAGYRTGMFTSPHLTTFTERIRVQNEYITEQAVAKLVEQIIVIGNAMQDQPDLSFPTFFEIVTAMGLAYFAEQAVDFAVVETGMGGRLDSTNIVHPVATVITSIGMDHARYLGNTLADIAYEKAGIIKNNTPLICGVQDPEACGVINDTAKKQAAPLTALGKDLGCSDVVIDWPQPAPPCQKLTVNSATHIYKDLQMTLIGQQQAGNAALAVGVIEALQQQGVSIPESALYNGLKNTVWPGRFEVVNTQPPCILDVACNPAAIKMLRQTILSVLPENSTLIFVLGFLGDKDYAGMCAELFPLADCIILTRPNNSRAADPATIQHSLPPSDEIEVRSTETVAEAVEQALTFSQSRRCPVCFTGSNYLISEVREKLSLAKLRPDSILSDNI